MSCQMNLIANFFNLDQIKQVLFGENEITGSSPRTLDNCNLSSSSDVKLPWLHECKLSMSSTCEILAIARKQVLAILTSKWDSQEESDIKTKYHLTYHNSIAELEGEEITSIICLPLLSQSKTSHGIPDWTCIIVGFSTGYIRIYTENGDLLISEFLHKEKIISIKCRSHETFEEIYIIMESFLCIISGSSLFQTLKCCRNQLARKKASCSESFKYSPIIYKKWSFECQETLNDCEVAGQCNIDSFDHLMKSSLSEGFNTFPQLSPPRSSLIVAVGKKPFVGFHYVNEGTPALVLTDVAKVVVTKVKSALEQTIQSWWVGSKKSNHPKPVEPRNQHTESLFCRFGIADYMRNADSITLSPNRQLGAVTDSLGRIFLIDVHKGVALRMWKGYRDAQCSWLEVDEDRIHISGVARIRSNKLRTALFLVIYAPKKGLLEIWAMEQGLKIATFTTSKCGRLLYKDYGFMGVTGQSNRTKNKPAYMCLFLDDEGHLTEIQVPFHLALNDKNSKRAKDAHLIKRLRRLLRNEDNDGEKQISIVSKTGKELETNQFRIQYIKMLTDCRYICLETLKVALETTELWNLLETEDIEGRVLLNMISNLNQLLEFYQFVKIQNSQPPNYNSLIASDLNADQNLHTLLKISEREVSSLKVVLYTLRDLAHSDTSVSDENSANNIPKGKVHFTDDHQLSLSQFLSGFIFNEPGSGLILMSQVSEDILLKIGEFLFQGILYKDCSLEDWQSAARASGLQPLPLLQLLLAFWLHTVNPNRKVELEMSRLHDIIKSICCDTGLNKVCAPYNENSPFWDDIRNQLRSSSNPLGALTAVFVCRLINVDFERIYEQSELNQALAASLENASEVLCNNNEKKELPLENANTITETENNTMQASTTSEWEKVSRDTFRWSELMEQLERLAILAAVLSIPPLPFLPRNKNLTRNLHFSCQPQRYSPFKKSLNDILSQGKGSVSALIAKWLSASGIDPILLIDPKDLEEENHEPLSEDDMPSGLASKPLEGKPVDIERAREPSLLEDQHARVIDRIMLLRQYFPYSASSSVLVANLCWEYVLAWKKSVYDIKALDAALACIRAIPSSHLKQGLCSLMWSMHVGKPFEAAARLIHTYGHLPSEHQQCWQEVGLTDLQIPQFLSNCTELLDIFMEAHVLSTMNSELNVRALSSDLDTSEDLWSDSDSGARPFCDLALEQPPVNYDLLYHHYQLAVTLHIIAALGLRLNKPITSLFDSMGYNAFFADMHLKLPLPSHESEPRLLNARINFLCRIISTAIENAIKKSNSTPDTPDDLFVKFQFSQSQSYSQQTNKWINLSHNLASAWRVSRDKLRRHHVSELYKQGLDRYAEEILPAVNDKRVLASQLLLIVGQRVKLFLEKSLNFRECVSKMSPSLSIWVESLKSLNHKNDIPLTDTHQLLIHVISLLNDDHPHLNFANQLLETLETFDDSNLADLNANEHF